jgi:hypothetical protein
MMNLKALLVGGAVTVSAFLAYWQEVRPVITSLDGRLRGSVHRYYDAAGDADIKAALPARSRSWEGVMLDASDK